MELVRRIVGDDARARDLLDQALQNKVGSNQHTEGVSIRHTLGRPVTVDDINGSTEPRPAGTTAEAALRRLRKDRPDLHEQVLDGELSPHGAMVLGTVLRAVSIGNGSMET